MKTKTTRLFYCVLIFVLLTVGKADAQMVYIPDSNFRDALISEGYGAAIYGDSLDGGDSLVINASILLIDGFGINDLTGMGAFINLQLLDCADNQLTFLPQLPSGLQALYCWDNQLTFLPQLPSGLHNLYCARNFLTTLPGLPTTLTDLTCRENNITSLPVLPTGLTYLDCWDNQLTTLPSLPPTLNYLLCPYNQLTALPSIPTSLFYIDCYYNQVQLLPPLPNNYFEHIDCSHNLLTSLPNLPDTLLEFYCDNNQITVLPKLPAVINELGCNNNLLTSLPALPASLYRLHCDNNINLTCLPKLYDMQTLTFDGTSISCIPNYVTISDQSSPDIGTFPLCDMFNSNACDYYWNISGTTYHDYNSTCVYNIGDTVIKNIPLQLFKNGMLIQQTSSMNNGMYDFDTDTNGIYEIRIDTTDLPLNVICPSSNLYNDTITLTDSLKTGNDFSFSCKGDLQVGIKNVHVGFVPGEYRPEIIYIEDLTRFYGLNCSSGENGIVTILFDGPVTYIGPSPGALTPNSVSGNLLTYIIPDFSTITPASFSLIVFTDTNAVLGSQVCVTVTTITTNLTTNIKKDSLHECFTIVSSWDPNNKQVSPVSDVDINGDGWLHYTINFQNTGTAQANNIYLLDTLDSNFDWSTFKLVDYSHQPQIQLFNTGLLRFNFPNINLPDSNANEPLSHGYVQYKVKLKPGLSVGTQVHNTAYIYFDFNTPVVTNTTQNVLVPPTGIAEIKNDLVLNVFPNPVHDILYVSFNKPLPANSMITICDMEGRIVGEKNSRVSKDISV